MPNQCRILVVDDHPVHRLLVKRSLAQEEFTVVVACDGEEAVEKLNSDNFDVVLTDLRMPRMNGYELNAQIKKQFPSLPVILLTSEYQSAQEQKDKHGFIKILKKPCNYYELGSLIKEALQSY